MICGLPSSMGLDDISIVPPPAGVKSNIKNPPSLANTAIGVISVVILLEVFFLAVRLHNNIKTFSTLMADDCALDLILRLWGDRLIKYRDGCWHNYFDIWHRILHY